jgi:2-keto-4-pentenoate hydratase/2-oxohepta-3-ene-1,7-dioic acid hydratase in catechol pathway
MAGSCASMAIFLGIDRKHASQSVDYECELAVVIGKPYHNVSRSETLDCVLGYTCADVSARDWQIKYGGYQSASSVCASFSSTSSRSSKLL